MADEKQRNPNEPKKERLTAIQAIGYQLGSNQMSEDQQNRNKKLTDAAKAFAEVILAVTKPSADQTASLRKLRELKYTLTSSIATEEFL